MISGQAWTMNYRTYRYSGVSAAASLLSHLIKSIARFDEPIVELLAGDGGQSPPPELIPVHGKPDHDPDNHFLVELVNVEQDSPIGLR